jgi:chemotaxis protein CheY-P-specific phosphatase CheC
MEKSPSPPQLEILDPPLAIVFDFSSFSTNNTKMEKWKKGIELRLSFMATDLVYKFQNCLWRT